MSGQQEAGLCTQGLSCSVAMQGVASLSECTQRPRNWMKQEALPFWPLDSRCAQREKGHTASFCNSPCLLLACAINGRPCVLEKDNGEGREWTAGMHRLRKVPELCPNAYSLLCGIGHGVYLLWVLVSLWKSNQPACIRPSWLSCPFLSCPCSVSVFWGVLSSRGPEVGEWAAQASVTDQGLRLPGGWAWVT